MTLIEVAIAMPIVVIALGMFIQMITAGSGMRGEARDDWAASAAAQDLIETMRNEEFRDLVRLYNADPFDDPGGPGTAPGNLFAVASLSPLEDGGPVGEVFLPIWNRGSEVVPAWEVREDIADVQLGTPRDLSGDSVVDDVDHIGDYTLLPIRIRLRWRGSFGRRTFELHTVLSELR